MSQKTREQKRPVGQDEIREFPGFEPEVDYVKTLFNPPPVDLKPKGPFKNLGPGVNFASVQLKK